jgi:hypothetical protein
MEKAASLRLRRSTICNNVVKQLATAGVLHDQVQLSRRLNDFVQLDDVRMPDELEYVDLSCNPLHVCNLHDALLLKHLHSNSFASEDVSSELHLAKCSLTDSLHEDIVANGFL